MSDLPEERLKLDPPFSYVGLDVFGPWEVISKQQEVGSVVHMYVHSGHSHRSCGNNERLQLY